MDALATRIDENTNITFPLVHSTDISPSLMTLLETRCAKAGVVATVSNNWTQGSISYSFTPRVRVVLNTMSDVINYLNVEKELLIISSIGYANHLREESRKLEKKNRVRKMFGLKQHPVKKYLSEEEIKVVANARYRRIINQLLKTTV